MCRKKVSVHIRPEKKFPGSNFYWGMPTELNNPDYYNLDRGLNLYLGAQASRLHNRNP